MRRRRDATNRHDCNDGGGRGCSRVRREPGRVASWVGPPGPAAADPGLSARASQAGNRPGVDALVQRAAVLKETVRRAVEFRRPSWSSGACRGLAPAATITRAVSRARSLAKSSSTFGCFTNDVDGLVSIAEVGDDPARLVNRGIRDGNVTRLYGPTFPSRRTDDRAGSTSSSGLTVWPSQGRPEELTK